MKCINKKTTVFILLCCMLAGLMTGCGNLRYEMPYNTASDISSFSAEKGQGGDVARTFAADLCVVSADMIDAADVDMSHAEAAVLFDVYGKEVLYSKNAHERLHPASLTKIMTALVAIKYGSLDQMLTATDAVNITESGAQLCGIKSGDTMTLDQALRILLLYSANDAANMIAENIGGSIDRFVEMMNTEAKRLGATNTNFVNPHGLTDENHYTTPYDLYLIFNEAIKYEAFSEIIQMTTYQTSYYSGNGREKSITVNTTNRYLKGEISAPDKVNVIGGKTGTTNAAGNCLILLSRDSSGDPYISVIMRADDNDNLYSQMTDLLGEIHK